MQRNVPGPLVSKGHVATPLARICGGEAKWLSYPTNPACGGPAPPGGQLVCQAEGIARRPATCTQRTRGLHIQVDEIRRRRAAGEDQIWGGETPRNIIPDAHGSPGAAPAGPAAGLPARRPSLRIARATRRPWRQPVRSQSIA